MQCLGKGVRGDWTWPCFLLPALVQTHIPASRPSCLIVQVIGFT